MRRLLLLALLLLFVAPSASVPAGMDEPKVTPVPKAPMTEGPPLAAAPDALKLPPKAELKRDHLVGVKAGTAAKRVTWEIPAGVDWQPKPADYKPPEQPAAVKVELDAGAMLFFTAGPGEYRIRAYAAVAESVAFAEMILAVTGDAPPKPPDPPKPPEPPAPLDAFKVDLLKLFAAEPDVANRKAQAATLAAVYKLAASETADKSYATFEDLATVIAAAIDGAKGLGPNALPSVRKRVRDEFATVFPDGSVELTDAARKKAGDVYARAAAALEEAAK